METSGHIHCLYPHRMTIIISQSIIAKWAGVTVIGVREPSIGSCLTHNGWLGLAALAWTGSVSSKEVFSITCYLRLPSNA